MVRLFSRNGDLNKHVNHYYGLSLQNTRPDLHLYNRKH